MQYLCVVLSQNYLNANILQKMYVFIIECCKLDRTFYLLTLRFQLIMASFLLRERFALKSA